MGKLQMLINENEGLKERIVRLEKELEFKDDKHLHELKTMRDYLQNLINKYCLN